VLALDKPVQPANLFPRDSNGLAVRSTRLTPGSEGQGWRTRRRAGAADAFGGEQLGACRIRLLSASCSPLLLAQVFGEQVEPRRVHVG